MARGQDNALDREYTIKAAYLYNFGKYVEWPAQAEQGGAGGFFVIGVVGPHEFDEALTKISRTKTLQERPVAVLPILAPGDYRPCHVLFVSAAADEALTAAILGRVEGAPSLTVGESPSFMEQGGMINFYIENNKVKFELNAAAAQRVGLKISSQLMRIGKLVP